MGSKRPNEGLQEFPLKHSKLVSLYTESYPSSELTHKADASGQDILFCKVRFDEGLDDTSKYMVSDSAGKEVEVSAPLSWVTSSTSEEDAGSGGTICSPLSPDYFEFFIPRRPVVHYDDKHSSLLDASPRKHVPLGPNHQAELPAWDPQALEEGPLGSNHFPHYDNAEKWVGDCVILMPNHDLPVDDDVKAGDGRKDCTCPDACSVRCVQQHIKEAREKIRETIGSDKFAQLGLCNIGERVSQEWTEEEEHIFHEVVYANPVSCGNNFWEHLSIVFPSRTKREIVGYYFNVFILRRRAVQNRSNFLDIDSDDDQWQGINGVPFRAIKEDDVSLDSVPDQGILVDNDNDSPIQNRSDMLDIESDCGEWLEMNRIPSEATGEYENFTLHTSVDKDILADLEDDTTDDEDNDNDEDKNNSDSDDGNVDVGNGEEDAAESENGRIPFSQTPIGISLDSRSELVHFGSKIQGSKMENVAKDVQYASFGCRPNLAGSCGSADMDREQDGEVKEGHKGSWHDNAGGSVIDMGPGYLLDLCDSRVWDARYPATASKDVDLLPTWNIIEEIFGKSNS